MNTFLVGCKHAKVETASLGSQPARVELRRDEPFDQIWDRPDSILKKSSEAFRAVGAGGACVLCVLFRVR